MDAPRKRLNRKTGRYDPPESVPIEKAAVVSDSGQWILYNDEAQCL